MKIIKEGHQYELANMEAGTQTISFIEKQAGENNQLTTVSDGTTNEEVLAVLIDRLNYLQAKAPCRENALVITKLEEASLWLGKRTADRIARGVEGTSAQ
jgi:autotransporter adhesin